MKCKFHPVDIAINYCDVCDENYCGHCSDESISLNRNRQKPEKTRCFVCKTPLNAIEGNSHIPPFWNKLSRIYRYPLSFDALVALVVVSLISAFFSNIGIVILLTSAAMTLYGFTSLHQTANGDNDAPGLDACFSTSVAPLFYTTIVITSSILSLMVINKYLGTGFGILVGTTYMFALPAAVIIIAVEESLMSALDPSKLIGVMKATGIDYFVMLIFIFIMYSSTFVLTSFFISEDPSFITVFISFFISNYYWVVTFHIMGYLVYQNHSNLGYGSNVPYEQQTIRPTEQLNKAKLDVLIKSGEFDAAASLARERISKSTASLWEWSMAFELTCIADSKKHVRQLFEEYIEKLNDASKPDRGETGKGDTDKISDAYILLIKHHPQFIIDTPSLALLVANALFDSSEFAKASKIIQDSKTYFTATEDKNRAMELLTNSRNYMQVKKV